MHGIEFNMSELADEVKLTRQSISKVMKKYSKWKMVKTRKEGRTNLYSINEESPLVQNIEQFDNILIASMMGEEKVSEIQQYLRARIPSAVIFPPSPSKRIEWDLTIEPGWSKSNKIDREIPAAPHGDLWIEARGPMGPNQTHGIESGRTYSSSSKIAGGPL